MGTKYKDSGIPWIGMIPSDWEVEQLSSLFIEHKNKNCDLAETNLLSLSYGKIIRKDINTKEGLLPQSFDGYNIIDKGDIVFRLTDLQNDKRSLRTGLCTERGIITSAYITLRKRQDLDSAFFHYLFHSYDICKVFYGLGDGVRQGMNYSDLRKLAVLFPPFSTQQRIADFLDRKCAEIDELAALQETMIAELKRYKQSVITEAVTGKLKIESGKVKGESGNLKVENGKMKDSGVEWIGEIPKGWEICRLKDIVGRRNEKAINSNVAYIGLEHLVGFSKEMVTTENVYDNEGANMCYANDVIFGKLRPYLGKAKVIEETCCCSSEFLVLCNAQCPNYMRYLILSGWFIEIVNASTYGTKMPRANADFILNMQVPNTPLAEQRAIADYLDRKCAEIDQLIAIKQQKIEALKEYKKSVIFEYVTGKREVER